MIPKPLKQQLQPFVSPQTDLNHEYIKFRTAFPEAELEAFWGYLFDQNLITSTHFQTLHTHTQIDLTTMPIEEAESDFVYEKPETPHELLGKIGEGAMGQIHLAKETDLRRKVAFKSLHEKVSQDQAVLAAFLNEVQITAQLDHPNIVPIYSLEQTEDHSLAYSMKLVQGKTLKDYITEAQKAYKQEEPLPEHVNQAHLLERFLDLCDAVYFAHSKGIIHRDLKPSNVMIGPYHELYLMDWGIARPIATMSDSPIELWYDEWPSESGKIIGTPRYLSPEQALGKNEQMDGRSDQFALGAILFELVCLKPAFRAKSHMDLLQKILRGQRQELSHAYGAYPIHKDLAAIINKAMATKRRHRYDSVAELAKDLRRFIQGKAVLARPESSLEKGVRWLNQRRQWVLTGLLTILALSAGVTIWNQYQEHQNLLQSRAKEQALNSWITRVYEQSQKIDTHFLKVEQALENLAATVKYHLLYNTPSQEPTYVQTQFRPPDLALAPYYNLPISVDWVITIPSYNAKESDYEIPLQKILPVRHHLKRMFSSDFSQPELLTAPEQRAMITTKGGPIIWMTIVLKEGVSLGYPGTDFSGEFDGRQRPYYTLAAHKEGNHWGNPYVDVTGRGLMLPAARSIYDNQGEFLGVVALDSIFDFIIENLLSLPLSSVRKTYLVDPEARVVVDSSQKSKFREDKSKAYHEFKLPLFDHPKVVKDILKGQSGYLETPEKLLIYYPLPTLGWYYIVEADPL